MFAKYAASASFFVLITGLLCPGATGDTNKTLVASTPPSPFVVTNDLGVTVDLFSREAYHAEFRYLSRECRQFDLSGAPIPTDGWSDNIPDVEWPYMQFAYFGLACVNLAQIDPERKPAIWAEVCWLLDALQTPRLSGFIIPSFGDPFGKEVVHPSCFVHGLFLTLALRYRDATADTRYDPIVHRAAKALADAYAKTDQAILGSYKTMWWLTDNFPALSALHQYDSLFNRNLSVPKAELLRSVQDYYLDSKTGMFATFVLPAEHRRAMGPRGVSMMYGLHFLADFAPDFAASQYALSKKYLFRPFLGYLALREYPEGEPEIADVASGPILLGLGPAASGFAIAAAVRQGDQAAAWKLAQAATIVGSPTLKNGELRYALMPPVGQAVVLYGKTQLRLPRE